MMSSNQHNKRRGNQWAAPATGEAGVAADAITPGLESVDPDQGGRDLTQDSSEVT